MRRRQAPPRVDHRQPWQIQQAALCGCRGMDDYCACQNEEAPWRYGLEVLPRPPRPWSQEDLFAAIDSATEVLPSGLRAIVVRAFCDRLEINYPDPKEPT